jgi:hypothetical protein
VTIWACPSCGFATTCPAIFVRASGYDLYLRTVRCDRCQAETPVSAKQVKEWSKEGMRRERA